MSVNGVVDVPPLKVIGQESAQCPYCREPLAKPIRQKKACSKCTKIIYPRKRPIDAKVVYFREDELDALEEQRAIAAGTYDVYLKQKNRKETVVNLLREKLGREPSDKDIKWSMLNDDLVSAGQAGHWGLYRNAKLAMADLLETEGKLSAALEAWVEVSIFDMNGATNLGIVSDEELRDIDEMSRAIGQGPGLRPFTLRLGQLLHHTVERMRHCVAASEAGEREVSEAFVAAWERMPAKQLLPLSQADTWMKLSQAVFGR